MSDIPEDLQPVLTTAGSNDSAGLAHCLDEAFGGLEKPTVDEVAKTHMDQSWLDAVGSKTWQELRPLRNFVGDGSEIVLLSPKAYRYYLPAYLYAMIDGENDGFYLDHVLDSLWYESLYWDRPYLRELWEERMPSLSQQQKKCVARFLVEIQRRTDDRSLQEGSNTGRIESMLRRYWRDWL